MKAMRTEEPANNELMKERVKDLSRAKGESVTSVLVNSGAGKNFFSNMKNAKPSETNIEKIAVYLGTSAEYIKGITDNPFPMRKNGNTAELLRAECAKLNADGIKKLAECAALLAENPLYSRKAEETVSETTCESAYENENNAEITYRAAHSGERSPAKVEKTGKNAENLTSAKETDEDF